MKEEQKIDARIAREAEKDDFKFVANDPRGQRVLRRLLEQAGIFRLSFAGENTNTTAFNEGARNVGLLLSSEIMDICPDKWVDIMKGD